MSSIPKDLVPIGRLVDNIQVAGYSSSRSLKLTLSLETFVTDLYRFSHWWLELPTTREEGQDTTHLTIMFRVLPLGERTDVAIQASLSSMTMAEQGCMRLSRYPVLVQEVLGTPVALEQQVGKDARILVQRPNAFSQDAERRLRFVKAVTGATVYVKLSDLTAVRPWIKA